MKHATDWDDLATVDPLWAVLSADGKRNGGWDLDEFFATGEADVAAILATASELGRPANTETALDFGCGVGRLTQAIADHFDQVTGVDISSAMLDLARQYNRHGERCRYILNDQNHLRIFAAESFDFICSRLTLQHLPRRHIRAYLRELVRVLRPGGLLVFQLPAEHRYRGFWHWMAHNIYATVTRKILRVPTTMEMYAIPRREVIRLLESRGARVLETTEDQMAGQEWLSYCYAVTTR